MGWLAVASGVVGTSYQLRRVRTLGVEGVSLATWVLFVYMGCFWITYGVAARSAQVVLGSALIMPIQLSILFRLAPWRRWAVPARALGYFVACCVTPTILWGWAGGVFGTTCARRRYEHGPSSEPASARSARRQANASLSVIASTASRVAPSPSLDDIRRHSKRELERLPDDLACLAPGADYPVEVAADLVGLAAAVDSRLEKQAGAT